MSRTNWKDVEQSKVISESKKLAESSKALAKDIASIYFAAKLEMPISRVESRSGVIETFEYKKDLDEIKRKLKSQNKYYQEFLSECIDSDSFFNTEEDREFLKDQHTLQKVLTAKLMVKVNECREAKIKMEQATITALKAAATGLCGVAALAASDPAAIIDSTGTIVDGIFAIPNAAAAIALAQQELTTSLSRFSQGGIEMELEEDSALVKRLAALHMEKAWIKTLAIHAQDMETIITNIKSLIDKTLQSSEDAKKIHTLEQLKSELDEKAKTYKELKSLAFGSASDGVVDELEKRHEARVTGIKKDSEYISGRSSMILDGYNWYMETKIRGHSTGFHRLEKYSEEYGEDGMAQEDKVFIQMAAVKKLRFGTADNVKFRFLLFNVFRSPSNKHAMKILGRIEDTLRERIVEEAGANCASANTFMFWVFHTICQITKSANIGENYFAYMKQWLNVSFWAFGGDTQDEINGAKYHAKLEHFGARYDRRGVNNTRVFKLMVKACRKDKIKEARSLFGTYVK